MICIGDGQVLTAADGVSPCPSGRDVENYAGRCPLGTVNTARIEAAVGPTAAPEGGPVY
jgi:hypothetical protein